MESFLPFGRPDFSDLEIQAVARVMRSGWVGMGPETLAFEQELAAVMQAPQVVCVNACTSALLLSLRVLGVGPGDEVVCPSLTWCSTANVALHLGARPVFCDIDPHTLCVTPETVLQALGERTRAVIPVHLGGHAVDVAALRAALPSHVQVVEDAAHALGATLPGGAPVGASGALTCFSFYANKAVSTGDGGAIAVHDAAIADSLRSLRLHGLGLDAWQRHGSPRDAMAASPLAVLGYKANYTDLQAAIGRVQLARQAEFAERRLATAEAYAQGLPALGMGFQAGLLDPAHARHLFIAVLPPALHTRRGEVLTALREQGIGATVHYPPLHRMPLYAAGGASQRLPGTDAIADRILTLPIGASVGPTDAQRVLTTLSQIIDRLPARQLA